MKIYSIQKQKKNSGEFSEIFVIEPLNAGQGITIGNTLRRILLSEMYGFAITDIQFSNICHEFDQSLNLREDITEILLNLKQIIFKPTFAFLRNCSQKQLSYKLLAKIKGPVIVTAGMLTIPDQFKILNPNEYICTIINESELEFVLTVKYSKLFSSTAELKYDTLYEQNYLNEGSFLNVDSVFNPIKNVNYKIKMIHDINGNIKESLFLEIITNGTITPKRALAQSLNMCLKIFYPILALIVQKKNSNKLL